MRGITYPALPTSAADFLGEVWKAYVHTRESTDWLVIYTSPELFKLYIDQCECLQRYRRVEMEEGFLGPPRYVFRTARVKQDPDLQGFKIRFLEDEFAWKN